MTRDAILKKCLPDTVWMNPVGRISNELTPEEFEQCYEVFFDSVLEISKGNISDFCILQKLFYFLDTAALPE